MQLGHQRTKALVGPGNFPSPTLLLWARRGRRGRRPSRRDTSRLFRPLWRVRRKGLHVWGTRKLLSQLAVVTLRRAAPTAAADHDQTHDRRGDEGKDSHEPVGQKALIANCVPPLMGIVVPIKARHGVAFA